MKSSRITISMLAVTIALTVSPSFGQRILNIGFSPIWPKDAKSTAWNLFSEIGYVFDQKVGVGGKLDMMWNINEKKQISKDTLVTNEIMEEEDAIYMFPISAFLQFDPVPQYVVHPVIKAQFGFNFLVRDYTKYDSLGHKIVKPKAQDPDGFYIGSIGKISLDAVYDVGEQAAFFIGYEHQIGTLNKRVSNNQTQSYRVQGPAIRLGVSILM